MLTVDYLNVYDQHGLLRGGFSSRGAGRQYVPVASIWMASFFDQAAYPTFIVESVEPQRYQGFPK